MLEHGWCLKHGLVESRNADASLHHGCKLILFVSAMMM